MLGTTEVGRCASIAFPPRCAVLVSSGCRCERGRTDLKGKMTTLFRTRQRSFRWRNPSPVSRPRSSSPAPPHCGPDSLRSKQPQKNGRSSRRNGTSTSSMPASTGSTSRAATAVMSSIFRRHQSHHRVGARLSLQAWCWKPRHGARSSVELRGWTNRHKTKSSVAVSTSRWPRWHSPSASQAAPRMAGSSRARPVLLRHPVLDPLHGTGLHVRRQDPTPRRLSCCCSWRPRRPTLSSKTGAT